MLLSVLTLPLAPVRGVVSLARVLQRQAENELYGPEGVRRQLEALNDAEAAGEVSPDERARGEQEVLDRVLARSQRDGPVWPAEGR